MWVIEEKDCSPTKLYLSESSNVDDLLRKAAKSREFSIKQPMGLQNEI